jgi:hypothetical protein
LHVPLEQKAFERVAKIRHGAPLSVQLRSASVASEWQASSSVQVTSTTSLSGASILELSLPPSSPASTFAATDQRPFVAFASGGVVLAAFELEHDSVATAQAINKWRPSAIGSIFHLVENGDPFA